MKYIGRLAMTSAAIITVLLAVGAIGFIMVGYIKSEATEIVKTVLPRLTFSASINSDQAEGYIRTLQVVFADTPSERIASRTELDTYIQRSTQNINSYQKTLGFEQSQTAEMKELIDARQEYQKIRERIFDLCEQGQVGEARQLVRTSLWQAYQRYSRAGDVLMASDIQSASSGGKHILGVCFITQFIVGIFSVVVFLAGFLTEVILVQRHDPTGSGF